MYNCRDNMARSAETAADGAASENTLTDIKTAREDFIRVMDDDFNTSAAIAQLHIYFKYINNLMKIAKKNNRQQIANTLTKILDEVEEIYGILGFFKQEPEKFIEEMRKKYLSKIGIEVDYIKSEINRRAEAKKEKNFELADQIRESLDEKGIILNDTVNGTTWDVKELY